MLGWIVLAWIGTGKKQVWHHPVPCGSGRHGIDCRKLELFAAHHAFPNNPTIAFS
jgi:hypothetical protein